MCCDGSDSLELVRTYSGVLGWVNNRKLTQRRLPRVSRQPNRPFLSWLSQISSGLLGCAGAALSTFRWPILSSVEATQVRILRGNTRCVRVRAHRFGRSPDV